MLNRSVGSVRPQTANVLNPFGIEGYRCPRSTTVLPSVPRWTVPKEKNKRYIDMVMKRSKGLPCPTKFHKTRVWKTGTIDLKLMAKRKTFLDEVGKKSK